MADGPLHRSVAYTAQLTRGFRASTGSADEATVATGGKSIDATTVATPEAPKKPGRKPRHSGFDRKPGRRPMKEYVVTKSELTELGGIGAFATLFLSFGTYLIGFAVDVSKDLAFNAGLAPGVQGFWGALRVAGGVGAVACLIIAVLLLFYGGLRLRAILNETDHGQ